MTTIELKPEPINVKSKISGTLSLKTNFSGHHMLSAAHFARQSAIIEKNYKDGITDELRAEHRAYVTGAIIVSVASLEATINEVFISARDNENLFKGFDPTIPKVLAELWSLDVVKKTRFLEKCRLVLDVANKEKFDTKRSLFRKVELLINLRNALVHYKHEWDTDLKKHKNVGDALKKCGFNTNPFSHANDAFFPKRCLGHGCAEWSVKSTIEFIEDFYRRMGFPPKWSKHQLSRLKTT